MGEPNKAVFLSYASQDAEAAQRICEALRAAGIEVWFDQSELRGGDAWDQQIRHEIHQCALFVPIISQQTQERLEGYFRHEWKLAIERTHHMAEQKPFLVPVVIDDTRDHEAFVPDAFRAVQWTRLPGGDTSAAFVERTKRLLSPELSPLSAVSGVANGARKPVPSSRRSKQLLLAVAAVVVLAALVYVIANNSRILKHSAAATTAFAPTQHSIAVLPFANLSGDKAQEYFSDGLTEELLNALTKVSELRVTSRWSAFSFKGKDLEVPEIGKLLHVEHILEGSVRKSGERIRVTAQLVDTATDTHVWSETYDRTLDDIFAVQDEISAAVVENLKVSLLGAPPRVRRVNPKVFELFLQARERGRLHTQEGYEASVALYRKGLAIDPNYAPAWSGLAYDYRRQANNDMVPMEEGYGLARDAVQHALRIDPSFAPAHAELGRIALDHDGDLAAAAQHFEHAFSLDPTNSDIVGYSAILCDSLGRPDQGIALNEYAVQRDPANPTLQTALGIEYRTIAKFDRAIDRFRMALSLSPGEIGTHYRMGETLLMKGDAAAALAEFQLEPLEAWRMIGLPLAYHALGRVREADTALSVLIEKHSKGWPYNIAYVFAQRGNNNRAMEFLEEARKQHDPSLSDIASETLFAGLRKDARWLPFMRKIGRAPEQLKAIKFEVRPPKN